MNGSVAGSRFVSENEWLVFDQRNSVSSHACSVCNLDAQIKEPLGSGLIWINHAYIILYHLYITYISLISDLYHISPTKKTRLQWPHRHGDVWAMHHGGWDLPYSTCPPVRLPGHCDHADGHGWSDVRSLGKISQNLPQSMGKKWKKFFGIILDLKFLMFLKDYVKAIPCRWISLQDHTSSFSTVGHLLLQGIHGILPSDLRTWRTL